MKKLNYLFLAPAALLLASCAQDAVNAPGLTGETATASFKVSIPKTFSTRAFGDGSSATALKVYAYETTTGDDNTTNYTYAFTANAEFETPSADNDGMTTTVNMDLVVGKNYTLAFFAADPSAFVTEENEDGVYSITAGDSSPVLTVNYDNMTGNTDYDCFSGTVTTGKVSSTVTGNVKLTRPVAQVNWGAVGLTESSSGNNYESVFGEDGAYILCNLTASNVNNKLDLFSGDLSNPVSVDIKGLTPPANTSYPANTPQATYTYVAAQYFLAPVQSSDNCNLTLDITNGNGDGDGTFTNNVVVSDAPIQANYQTNIYGSLLTSNASYTITTTNTWGTIDNPLKWDGKVTYPTIPTTAGTVPISRPSDLAGLADIINGANGQNQNSLEGYTIELGADFDMGGNSLSLGSATRDGSSVEAGSNSFKGVFDGKGHTISNLVLNGTEGEDEAVGFIPSLAGSGAALQNVTFDNISVSAPESKNVGLVGLVTDGAKVSNVTVSGGTINGKSAGGIVGRMIANGTIESCNNYATITSTGSNSGGIVGSAYYTRENETLTISKCTNYGEIIANITTSNSIVGGIAGLCAADIDQCTNEGNITSKQGAVGGIVGIAASAGGVNNSINKGNISGTQYVGGIAGWITYYGGDDYQRLSVVYLTGNTNYGNVTGTGATGGILGFSQNSGTLTDNTNNAEKLAGNGVAGIIGSASRNTSPAVGTGYLVLSGNVNNTSTDNMTGSPKQSIYNGTIMVGDDVYTGGEMPSGD